MKVAIRVDASAQIGTGHLARCLTLANMLQARGAAAEFVCRSLAPFMAEQITTQGHSLKSLPAANQPLQTGPADVAHAAWLAVSQEQDAIQSRAVMSCPDILIVDHYGIDHRWQEQMRRSAGAILVIDDLADRRHDCDLLLDQNLQDSADRYTHLTPPACELLLGTRYALLRPEFSLPIIRGPHAIPRLNIFLGGTDPQGGTLLALRAIAPLCGTVLEADVVAGAGNPHLAAIRDACAASPAMTLHVECKDMAALFTAADLAIGAGGSAALERCSRGLPQLLTSFALNQIASCEAFAQAGVAVNLGPMASLTVEALRNAVQALLAKPEQRARMSELGRAMVDGKGARRVAERTMSLTGALS